MSLRSTPLPLMKRVSSAAPGSSLLCERVITKYRDVSSGGGARVELTMSLTACESCAGVCVWSVWSSASCGANRDVTDIMAPM